MNGEMLSPTSFNEDRYIHVCPIGGGACGSVTLYNLKGTTIYRAVKFARNFALSGKELSDFKREVDTLYKHQHPSIVKVYSYGIPETENKMFPWIELEFIPGGTAFDLIRNFLILGSSDDFIDPTYLLIIFYGIASALSFLHKKSVIHRDVKSSNVFIDSNNEPHLGDFGFARELKPGDDITSYPHTINYAAPELLLMKHYDYKVDVFSFGMMIYEMIMLKIPFSHMSKEKIANEIIKGNFPQITENNIFFNLYNKCSQYDPNKRPTMSEVVSMLDSLSKDIPNINYARFTEYRDRIVNTEQYFDSALSSFDKNDNNNSTENDNIYGAECGTLENLELAADLNPKAMYQMGWIYSVGAGVEQSDEIASEYFRSAGDMGLAQGLEAYIDMIDSGKISNVTDDEFDELCDRLSDLLK